MARSKVVKEEAAEVTRFHVRHRDGSEEHVDSPKTADQILKQSRALTVTEVDADE